MRPTPMDVDMMLERWHFCEKVVPGTDAYKWSRLELLLSKLIGAGLFNKSRR
jgi:hypothetical protein